MATIMWQRLAEAGDCLTALPMFVFLEEVDWWLAALLFFAPDISFAAYLAGPGFGAGVIDLLHVCAFGAPRLAAGAGHTTKTTKMAELHRQTIAINACGPLAYLRNTQLRVQPQDRHQCGRFSDATLKADR